MTTFDPEELMQSQEWAKWSDCRDMVQEAHDIGYAAALEAQAAELDLLKQDIAEALKTITAYEQTERAQAARIATLEAALRDADDEFANMGLRDANGPIRGAIRAALAKQP